MSFKLKYGQKKNLTIACLVALSSITSYELVCTKFEVDRLEVSLAEAKIENETLNYNLTESRMKYSEELYSKGELLEELYTISNKNSIPVIIYGEEQLKAHYTDRQLPLESTVNLYELASTLGYVVTYNTKENTITLSDPQCGITSSDVIVLEGVYDEETGEFSLDTKNKDEPTYGKLPLPDRN